jgi:hypothetical protein
MQLESQRTRGCSVPRREVHDLGETGRGADRDNGGSGLSSGDDGARGYEFAGLHGHRIPFSGQDRHIDTHRRRHNGIRSDPVPRRQQDRVPHDHVERLDVGDHTISAHSTATRDHIRQPIHGSVGTTQLDRGEQRVDEHDRDDRDRERSQPHEHSERGGRPQQRRKEVHGLGEQGAHEAMSGSSNHRVGTVASPSVSGLDRTQTRLGLGHLVISPGERSLTQRP